MPKQTDIVIKQIANNKLKLIVALEKSLGIVTSACKLAGVGRATYYEYMNTDEGFAILVRDMENVALDYVESKLFKNIDKGREASIIFYLKTKGKHRGYVEKLEVGVTHETYVANEMSKLDNLEADEVRILAEITTKLVGDGPPKQG